ncbi:hypothetical protein PTW35_26980 (plasmid) [Photobacterium sp. DA100]|nr:hypothetical protein [Photobacterium sp. DA100]WEM44895.1 hypothetical protein PTW35_26980 [Photobacterium sp. DA100]
MAYTRQEFVLQLLACWSIYVVDEKRIAAQGKAVAISPNIVMVFGNQE